MIRLATAEDFEVIWPFFEPIVRAGETYTYDRAMTFEEAVEVWIHLPRVTYLFEEAGQVLGSYYLKTNQQGPGAHVCNCGYMVAPAARGKGVASSLCEHSQRIAIELGYKAMQYNAVVSTNTVAVKLWQKMGFEVIGKLPRAFDHPTHGLVDALVMYKWLTD